jgi:Domain of unknown function (DUF4388)
VTLRGSTSDFPLESVIGLLAGTSKTGELQVRADGKVGALGFASGRLVAAMMDGDAGENALGAIFAISQAEFEFTPWETAPDANLEGGDLVSLLKRAAEARDRITNIRSSIPDDRMRFKLSEKAADQGAVTFTPDRWRALLAVNGERDVAAISEQLRLGKMQTLGLLVGLVKDGVIEALPPIEQKPVEEAPPKSEAPPSYREPEKSATPEPSEPPRPEPDWSAPRAVEESPASSRDWSSSASTPAWQEPEPVKEEPPQATEEWKATEAPAQPEVREDLQAEIAQRMDGFEAVPEPPAQNVDVPPAVDDRLSSLSGLFAPGPAANAPTPQAQPPKQEAAPTDWWKAPGGGTQGGGPAGAPSGASGGRTPESWTSAPPASKEAPANAWAPTAKPKEPQANVNPWGAPEAATQAPPPETPPAARVPSRADEWAPPPSQPAPDAAADKEKKKSGGLFGRFRKEETPPPTPIAHIPSASPTASRTGKLASLSNALLMEFNSGGYGKGKIETRLSNLLMRVDEQADPIDRPLPVVDDLIDSAALEREGFDEQQAVPYLATLVRQIYEDAERAFGKDKAKKGYKAAQQQVFGSDVSVLQSPDLAGKLPKV